MPLYGVPRTRDIESRAAVTLAPHTLMQRAGFAVARLALALAPHAQRVWVAAGPGNNGGDGLQAAAHLSAAGKQVHVTLHSNANFLPDDARDALARAHAAGVSISDAPLPGLLPHDIAIDALLGIGASRAPDAVLARSIALLGSLPCPVLAVDVPSGLDVWTGQALGDACVRAQHTLSLLTLKPGLFTAAGRDHAGVVWFDDLQCDRGNKPPDAWLTGADHSVTPRRLHTQHKGSFGDVAIVGGATGMTGAALLAARAAHAAGAGRIYVSLLDDTGLAVDLQRPELMFRRDWWKGRDATLAQSTVVCGCGGGDAVREPLPRLLSTAARLVLDADALNAISTDANLQSLLRARAARQRPTVLTPHPLEAARLLGSTAAQVQADRLKAAQTLAEQFRCVVLLKGSGSVIAAPDVAPHINPTGSAALATAGTGDVLAGWLGGLWSQQSGATTEDGAMRVACSAAYQHGAAADDAGVAVMRAGDLIDRLHRS
jgi:hydroxyethylthiazole kinase-like uncharacterized protein yjeF